MWYLFIGGIAYTVNSLSVSKSLSLDPDGEIYNRHKKKEEKTSI